MKLTSFVKGIVLSTIESDWEFNGKTGISRKAVFFAENSKEPIKVNVDETIFKKVTDCSGTFKNVTIEIEISIYENKTVLKVVDLVE
ncbi:MAG: hypothetical protein ACRDD4_13195 [Culicoidibacterales bacterium]